ncbi:MAG: hypothetical protein GXX83_00805 [Gaiellales bacterium]|nr:hypothetical protein [Gaiellales bacterium]
MLPGQRRDEARIAEGEYDAVDITKRDYHPHPDRDCPADRAGVPSQPERCRMEAVHTQPSGPYVRQVVCTPENDPL